MSIIQNPIIGRARKSAGNMRFSTWRGVNVMATKPFEVRQNVTPAVQMNRNKMAIIGKFVSKMNSIVNSIYSLGISKTTPFADTVKFFRTRLLDTLKLDASLLAGASFGTGNVASPDYFCNTTSMSNLEISSSNISNIWGTDDVDSTILVFNDVATKVAIIQVSSVIDDDIFVDLGGTAFIVGDKIAFAVKPVRFRPGADLSGKMKLMSNTGFITLTA